jgi:hypothetical protein
VRPLHVRHALGLWGGLDGLRLRLSKGGQFGTLLERFSEGEESKDNDDVPLAGPARIGKGKAIARNNDKDDEDEADKIDEGAASRA